MKLESHQSDFLTTKFAGRCHFGPAPLWTKNKQTSELGIRETALDIQNRKNEWEITWFPSLSQTWSGVLSFAYFLEPEAVKCSGRPNIVERAHPDIKKQKKRIKCWLTSTHNIVLFSDWNTFCGVLVIQNYQLCQTPLAPHLPSLTSFSCLNQW